MKFWKRILCNTNVSYCNLINFTKNKLQIINRVSSVFCLQTNQDFFIFNCNSLRDGSSLAYFKYFSAFFIIESKTCYKAFLFWIFVYFNLTKRSIFLFEFLNIRIWSCCLPLVKLTGHAIFKLKFPMNISCRKKFIIFRHACRYQVILTFTKGNLLHGKLFNLDFRITCY